MSVVQDFKDHLEGVLDDGFPKIDEEGPEKVANKRGQALAIFAEAVIQVRKIVQAFGGCEKCFGKGYATQHLPTGEKMNFCSCERGAQLEKLFHGTRDA